MKIEARRCAKCGKLETYGKEQCPQCGTVFLAAPTRENSQASEKPRSPSPAMIQFSKGKIGLEEFLQKAPKDEQDVVIQNIANRMAHEIAGTTSQENTNSSVSSTDASQMVGIADRTADHLPSVHVASHRIIQRRMLDNLVNQYRNIPEEALPDLHELWSRRATIGATIGAIALILGLICLTPEIMKSNEQDTRIFSGIVLFVSPIGLMVGLWGILILIQNQWPTRQELTSAINKQKPEPILGVNSDKQGASRKSALAPNEFAKNISGLLHCEHCGITVLAMSDGTCPGCRRVISQAEPKATPSSPTPNPSTAYQTTSPREDLDSAAGAGGDLDDAIMKLTQHVESDPSSAKAVQPQPSSLSTTGVPPVRDQRTARPSVPPPSTPTASKTTSPLQDAGSSPSLNDHRLQAVVGELVGCVKIQSLDFKSVAGFGDVNAISKHLDTLQELTLAYPGDPMPLFLTACAQQIFGQGRTAEEQLAKCCEAFPWFWQATLIQRRRWILQANPFMLPSFNPGTETIHDAINGVLQTNLIILCRVRCLPEAVFFLKDSGGEFDASVLEDVRIEYATTVSSVTSPQVIAINGRIHDNPNNPYQLEVMSCPFRPLTNAERITYEFFTRQPYFYAVITDRRGGVLTERKIPVKGRMAAAHETLARRFETDSGTELSASDVMRAMQRHQSVTNPQTIHYD